MIQRIQSVYLVLTFLLSVLFLSGEFFTFSNSGGTRIVMDFNGLWRSGGSAGLELTGNHYYLTIVFILIGLASFIDIFLYRKRRLQLLLAKILVFITAASAGLTIYYLIYLPGQYEVSLVPGYRIIIPPLVLVLCLLAHHGIRKDKELIRSYDRLR